MTQITARKVMIMSLNRKELDYAIRSNEIFHEYTMDSILNRVVYSANTQVTKIDSMQLDYHLKMVGNAYNSFRKLVLDKQMIDRASRAISVNPNSTFNIVTRIPDENEITEIRPKAIIRYVNMIDKGLSDITKGKIDNKKEKKLTSYDEIMKNLAPDLLDGDIEFFRDNCHYNVAAIARSNNGSTRSINTDTINYYIIPWIYSFENTSKKISDIVKDYRITIEYIRTTVPRILNNASKLRQQGIQNRLAYNRYGQFSVKATSNLLNIISFLTILVMRKINSTIELMNKYTEVCRCFLEYTNKEIRVVKEDFSVEDEFITDSSWYKFINGDTSTITRSCEDILNYYSEYNDLSKNELIILNDLDKSDIVVNPYNLDKSLNYSTYDTEPYNVKEVFYEIEAGLKNFEQSMTDEFKFANKIISESGLTLDMNSQYREKIEPITSMERYSTPESVYSRSVPFMICKELICMPNNLKIITNLAKEVYDHAINIRDRVTENPNKEIADDFVNESLRTFMSNFIESYKSLAATIYDAFIDRVNALNKYLNGLNLSDKADMTPYSEVEESYNDLNSDLDLISFEDTVRYQNEVFRKEEIKAAKYVVEKYISNTRGDVFTEAGEEAEDKNENETEKTDKTSNTKSDDTGDTSDSDKDGNNDDTSNNTDSNDSNGTEKKGKFFSNIIEKIKRALLSYLNKMRGRLDEEFTSKDFMSKINAVLNDESIEYLNNMSEGRYNNRILKTAVQGYVGPMYGPNKRSVNGKSYTELENVVKNFDVNFKNIDVNAIVNANEENYRKVILEQFFRKTLNMSNVTIPETIRSDTPMSEVTDFIRERIYETWSYGGLNKQEGGSDNEIGTGPETGSPKKKFVTDEVIKFLKYCKANRGETPAGWLPDKTTLDNTMDKLEKSFTNSYKGEESGTETSIKDDNDKKQGQDALIKKKIEFCGTCFNTTSQAFKDCIISRARDYINVLNRLVPDDIRGRNGGEAEGISNEEEEDKKDENKEQ